MSSDVYFDSLSGYIDSVARPFNRACLIRRLARHFTPARQNQNDKPETDIVSPAILILTCGCRRHRTRHPPNCRA